MKPFTFVLNNYVVLQKKESKIWDKKATDISEKLQVSQYTMLSSSS